MTSFEIGYATLDISHSSSEGNGTTRRVSVPDRPVEQTLEPQRNALAASEAVGADEQVGTSVR